MPGPPTPLMGQLRHLFCTTSSSVPGGMKPHLPQYNLPEEHPFLHCLPFPASLAHSPAQVSSTPTTCASSHVTGCASERAHAQAVVEPGH